MGEPELILNFFKNGFDEFKLNLIIKHHQFKLQKYHEFDNDEIIQSAKNVKDS